MPGLLSTLTDVMMSSFRAQWTEDLHWRVRLVVGGLWPALCLGPGTVHSLAHPPSTPEFLPLRTGSRSVCNLLYIIICASSVHSEFVFQILYMLCALQIPSFLQYWTWISIIPCTVYLVYVRADQSVQMMFSIWSVEIRSSQLYINSEYSFRVHHS